MTNGYSSTFDKAFDKEHFIKPFVKTATGAQALQKCLKHGISLSIK